MLGPDAVRDLTREHNVLVGREPAAQLVGQPGPAILRACSERAPDPRDRDEELDRLRGCARDRVLADLRAALEGDESASALELARSRCRQAMMVPIL